ncbi:MAG TPA: hypothetical protein VG742_15150 [Dongiaceae bacterium]|jgi:hypothetical protein|nr:hypothetical protein [Dongiaceae bacterium]
MAIIKPLTKRQLIEYFQVYRDAFPEWAVEHDVVLVRTQGPVTQYISFEALRSGAYRPACSVEVAGPPNRVQMLFRFLDIKHRQVLPREHPTMWPRVLKAMEEQFFPSIRRPLDVAEVLRLAEEEVQRDRIDNINFSAGLAVLNAHVGNTERALLWCEQAERQAAGRGPTAADWELQQVQFTRELREVFENGDRESLLRWRDGRQG